MFNRHKYKSKKRVFIPDHCLPQVTVVLGPHEEGWVTLRGFEIPGIWTEIDAIHLESHFHSWLRVVDTSIEDKKDPHRSPILPHHYDEILMYPFPLHEIVTTVEEGSHFTRQEYTDVIVAMEEELEELSRMTGKSFRLQLHRDGQVRYPSDDDVIDVVIGAASPGPEAAETAAFIDDIALRPDCRMVKYAVSEAGYGANVTDHNGKRVAQVVGSTFYLFLPLYTDTIGLFAGRGTNLFRTVLCHAWNAYVDREKDRLRVDHRSLDTVDDYQVVRSLADNAYQLELKEQIARTDREIASLSSRLVRLQLSRRDLMMRSSNSSLTIGAQEMALEYQAIIEHPLVERLENNGDDTIWVHTKPVIVTGKDSVKRDLGSFIISVDVTSVSVWSKRLTHQQRIPHPHINVEGTACYGNITHEINRALGENRRMDAALLVLSWLEEGYDETLADRKIEEWPEAGSSEAENTPDLDHVFRLFRRPETEEKG